jgi:hypothetical protein
MAVRPNSNASPPVIRRNVLDRFLDRRFRDDPPAGGVSMTDILLDTSCSVAAAWRVRIVVRRGPQELPVGPYF